MGLKVNPLLKKYVDDLVAAEVAALETSITNEVAALTALIIARVPVGLMLIWNTDTAPDGWLLCYGQAVSRNTYNDLFALIGTTFGIGNGSTTFNLPDLRGRLPLGQDDMGGTSADRVTNAQADIIGGSAGAENHTLTIAEIPPHIHTIPTGSVGGTEEYAIENAPQEATINSGSTGGDDAHNNVQPYLTTNYIIKY